MNPLFLAVSLGRSYGAVAIRGRLRSLTVLSG